MGSRLRSTARACSRSSRRFSVLIGDLFKLVTYDAGACSAHNAALVRASDLHYLFGLTAGQPTLLQEAKRWLGPRKAHEADAVSEDFERGNRVVRRLFIGQVTVVLDGWEHLRTVLRIQTETVGGPEAHGNRRLRRGV
jgi:hypothetical protein